MVPDEYPDNVTPFKRDLASLWEEDLNRRTQADQGIVATEIMLPSGLPVRAHRVHLLHLLRHGRIPNSLLPIVEKHIALATEGGVRETIQDALGEFEQDEQSAYKKFSELLDHVWLQAVIEPKFARNPDREKKELPLSAVSFEDKTFLYEWCQGVNTDVASFRERQARIVDAVQNGENLLDITMSIIRDRHAEKQLAGMADQQ